MSMLWWFVWAGPAGSAVALPAVSRTALQCDLAMYAIAGTRYRVRSRLSAYLVRRG